MVVNEKKLLETIKSQIIHSLNMGNFYEIQKLIIQSLIELDKIIKRNDLEKYEGYFEDAIREYENLKQEDINNLKLQIRQYLLPNIDDLIKLF